MASYSPDRSFVQATIDAVLKAGLRPVDMAYFAARENEPAEYCQQQVRECDIYLAVVGFCYGSLVADRDDGVSYTELEFLAATEARMPWLVFVLDEQVQLPLKRPGTMLPSGIHGKFSEPRGQPIASHSGQYQLHLDQVR